MKIRGQGDVTFSIDSISGAVKLNSELDFEDLRQTHVYKFEVSATQGTFATSVEVSFYVYAPRKVVT